jgi:hypothetical protein
MLTAQPQNRGRRGKTGRHDRLGLSLKVTAGVCVGPLLSIFNLVPHGAFGSHWLVLEYLIKRPQYIPNGRD